MEIDHKRDTDWALRLSKAWATVRTNYVANNSERLMALAVELSALATEMSRTAYPDNEQILGGGFRVDDRTPDVITDDVLRRRLDKSNPKGQ